LDNSFTLKLYQSHKGCTGCPSPEMVNGFFVELLGTLFPDFTKLSFGSQKEFDLHYHKLQVQLDSILTRNNEYVVSDPDEIVENFFNALPEVHEKLQEDATAMYMGDPAAKSLNEVVRTYPGFYAIAAYRIANILSLEKVKVIPRIITEHAHSKTGIDIHPAATIGRSFCVDHGTGVVIGETSVIGNHVKLYQGVTLGALSVRKEDAEKKRHPTLEDNVVIYSGATILGGETIIGKNSIIGGNVWLTESVEPNSKIYYKNKTSNGIQTELID